MDVGRAANLSVGESPALLASLAPTPGHPWLQRLAPEEAWRQIWSNNPAERLNREIRRRTDVVDIFPDRDSVIRLVGAVLAEQHDEWAEGRRYLGLDVLARCRIRPLPDAGAPREEVTTTSDIPALSAQPDIKSTR
jgi:hypothetical protein